MADVVCSIDGSKMKYNEKKWDSKVKRPFYECETCEFKVHEGDLADGKIPQEETEKGIEGLRERLTFAKEQLKGITLDPEQYERYNSLADEQVHREFYKTVMFSGENSYLLYLEQKREIEKILADYEAHIIVH